MNSLASSLGFWYIQATKISQNVLIVADYDEDDDDEERSESLYLQLPCKPPVASIRSGAAGSERSR